MASCATYSSDYDGVGSFDTGEQTSYLATGLAPNSIYYYRVCGKGTNNRISDGEVREFRTINSVATSVSTTSATDVTATSARLNGVVNSGDNIASYSVWHSGNGNVPSCASFAGVYDSMGNFNSGDNVYLIVTNLIPGTIYYYRICGHGYDGVSDGGIRNFTTDEPPLTCGNTYQFNGGQEGISADIVLGNDSGNARVGFEAFTVPDRLTISQGNNVLYGTGGYVSGFHNITIFHNANNGQEWTIRVDGNPDIPTTLWEISVSCPQ